MTEAGPPEHSHVMLAKRGCMKGLDLCEGYYRACGETMIRAAFPELDNRIAVGLVGEGSDCFGFDDEVSRDHDWGPGFCLWLESDDYRTFGPALQSEYEKLPESFEGYRRIPSRWGKSRVGVFEIGDFYRRFIGTTAAPDDPVKWFYLPEPNLAACTNGKVFDDPLGRFSAVREEILSFFPEDVRLAKIASRCVAAAQAGQYNYPRTAHRNEPFATQYAVIKFASEIISLVFLLNRRFCPFYKWSHRAVRSLPILGDSVFCRITELITETDVSRKTGLIEQISSDIIAEIRQQQLSSDGSDFLLDHVGEIKKKIFDPAIKRLVGL